MEDEFKDFQVLIDGLGEENERHNKLIEGLKLAKENSSNSEVTQQISRAINQANEKYFETGSFKRLEDALQKYTVECSLEKWEKVKEKIKELFKDVKGIDVEKVFNESRDYMLRILETSNVVNTEIDDVECGSWITKTMLQMYLNAYFQPGTDLGSSFRFKFMKNQKPVEKVVQTSSEKRKKTVFESSDDSVSGNDTGDDETSTPAKKRPKLFMKTGACSFTTAKNVEKILMDDINKSFEEIIEILRTKDDCDGVKKLEASAKFKFYVNNLKNKMRRESFGTPSTTKKSPKK